MNEIINNGEAMGIDWPAVSKNPDQLPRDFVIKVLHKCIQLGIMTTQLITENGETDGQALRSLQGLADGGKIISQVQVFKDAQEKIAKFVTEFKEKEEALKKVEAALMGTPVAVPKRFNLAASMEKQKVFISRDYVTFDQMKRVLSRIAKQRK